MAAAALETDVAPPPPSPAPRVSRLTLVVAALTVLAGALRLYRLGFGYAHGVIDYDSGVYFGASLELVHGVLPYRDFSFVHPPVITLLLAPDALLANVIGTAQAMGIAKVLTGLAGTASVPLIARLLRRRGTVVVTLACAIVALAPDAVASAYSLLLEPWVVLLCLAGAALVFDGDDVAGGRRLWWGGVLLGLGCATKIWAFAPVIAILLICRHRRTVFASGTAAGFVVPVLPFFVLAPGGFVHQVFVVQLFRAPGVDRTTLGFRLVHLLGVGPPNATTPTAAYPAMVAGAVALLVLLAVIWARTLRGSTALDRFGVLAAVLVLAMFLAPGTFYWHYAAFSTPFLVLAAVLPIRSLPVVPRRAWTVVLAVVAIGIAVTMAHRDARSYHRLDDHVAVDAVVPSGACVVSTTVSATIAQDRFRAGDGCPALIDPFGAILDLTDGHSPSRSSVNEADVVRLWRHALGAADFLYVKTTVSPVVPTDARVQRYLRAHFRVVPVDAGGTLYQRI